VLSEVAGDDARLAAPGLGHLSEETWLGTTVRCYPDRVPTLVHALDRAVRLFPDRTAVEVDEGDEGDESGASTAVTYGELAELVEGAVERLAAEGVQRGDRVAFAARNGLDLIVAIWACARAGWLFVGLSTRLQPPQWAYMLAHSGASLAFGHPEFEAGLRSAAAEAGMADDRVALIGDRLTGTRRPWRGDAVAFPDQDDVYGVVYTSGTTGRPKASQLAHRCSMHSATAYVRTLALTERDRTAISFPLYYVTGHVAQVTPMMLVGGVSVPVVDLASSKFVQLIAQRRITYLMVVPSLWPLLMREPGFRFPELAHLEIGAFGGSPVPVSTIGPLRERMPQLRLFDAYGLTETHSPATCLLDHEFRRKPGSVGRPVPCADVRIVDDEGNDCGPDEPGELWIKGPMVTPGYYNDRAATAAAITDGWLHSGDYARVDAEGYVFILDRKKDMITRGGNKIYSVELEYLLVSHPDIAEAAVVGIPDRLAYEAVAAWVVPAAGRSVDAQTVQQWVNAKMSDYAVPRFVRIVDALPRNRTGKIDKRSLRENFVAERAAPTYLRENP
jgi:acyl-CoA synthetase (AMP-forming)/AMP-acid ligase II